MSLRIVHSKPSQEPATSRPLNAHGATDFVTDAAACIRVHITSNLEVPLRIPSHPVAVPAAQDIVNNRSLETTNSSTSRDSGAAKPFIIIRKYRRACNVVRVRVGRTTRAPVHILCHYYRLLLLLLLLFWYVYVYIISLQYIGQHIDQRVAHNTGLAHTRTRSSRYTYIICLATRYDIVRRAQSTMWTDTVWTRSWRRIRIRGADGRREKYACIVTWRCYQSVYTGEQILFPSGPDPSRLYSSSSILSAFTKRVEKIKKGRKAQTERKNKENQRMNNVVYSILILIHARIVRYNIVINACACRHCATSTDSETTYLLFVQNTPSTCSGDRYTRVDIKDIMTYALLHYLYTAALEIMYICINHESVQYHTCETVTRSYTRSDTRHRCSSVLSCNWSKITLKNQTNTLLVDIISLLY